MKQKILLYLFITFCWVCDTKAQWDGDPGSVNNPIAASANSLFSEVIVSDQYGGAIVLWKENNHLFLRRKTVGGLLAWKTGGPILLNSGYVSGQTKAMDMIPDGNGGVYVSWTENRTDSTIDLFLQHIASNGEKSFTDVGIKVNPADQPVCSEGKLSLSETGVIIVWATEQNEEQVARTNASLLFLQKFSASGQPMWNLNGVLVSTAPGFKLWPTIASDGSNGVYVSFTDTRNSTMSSNGYFDHYDVYLQHFDGQGNRLWDMNDIALNSISTSEISLSDYSPPFVKQRKGLYTDESGAAIVLYQEDVQGYAGRLFAQKVDASGSLLWGNGIQCSPLNGSAIFIQVQTDSNKGLAVAWKNVGENAVYLQKVDSTGNLVWGSNGIIVNPSTDVDAALTGIGMVKDSNENFVLAWKTDSIINNQMIGVIKAQKISKEGNYLWDSAGKIVCAIENEISMYPTVLNSLNSATLITWGGSRGIYAALANEDGTLKTVSTIEHSATASGNWNDPSIWASGVVPPPGANITITQNITVNIGIICNSITVQPPATMFINPGVSVVIFNN